ncbi:MAG: ROK family protein, partial [Terracidiphilus sp.]
MTTAIGVVITERVVSGMLQDQRLTGKLLHYPTDPETQDGLAAMPASELVGIVAGHIGSLAEPAGSKKQAIEAIGVAVPGIVRHGVVEESPNLKQLKGLRLAEKLAEALAERGIAAPVHVANDADAIAAGVASTRGRLDKLTRVWTIGNGIGYGRWPYVDGVWEGGHITVTLDPKERYCGCGGAGHLEGIMGY